MLAWYTWPSPVLPLEPSNPPEPPTEWSTCSGGRSPWALGAEAGGSLGMRQGLNGAGEALEEEAALVISPIPLPGSTWATQWGGE